MKKNFFILFLLFFKNIYSQPFNMITCTFLPYPEEKFFAKVQPPISMSSDCIPKKQIVPESWIEKTYTESIPVIYSGYESLTNTDGQVSFPKIDIANDFILVITIDLEPIFMARNTLYSWQIKPGGLYAAYAITLSLDKKTNSSYWKTEKVLLTEKNIIPLNGIVVFAQPEDIFIPCGITPTQKTLHVTLPSFFVKPTIENHPYKILSLLPFLPFYRSIRVTLKEIGDKVQTKIDTTLS